MLLNRFIYNDNAEEGAGSDPNITTEPAGTIVADPPIDSIQIPLSELEALGFKTIDDLKAHFNKPAEPTEEEKQRNQQIEKADFLNYGTKEGLITVDEYQAFETLKAKADRDLVFENFTQEFKEDNPDAEDYEVEEEQGLHWIFEPLNELEISRKERNTLICAIIYSYDNESTWIDLKQDGQVINGAILRGLKADLTASIYDDFLNQRNEKISETIGNYLDALGDWRFTTVRKHIDYHAKYIRMTENEEDFKGLDAVKKTAARENMGKLMREAVNHRKAADLLIQEIHRDYVSTQHRVSQDFNKSYVEESIKRDPYSWRQFVYYDLPIVLEKRKLAKQSKLPI